MKLLSLLPLLLRGVIDEPKEEGLLFGIAELIFVIAMFHVHHQASAVAYGLTTIYWQHSSYIYLVAVNVGVVIMPWMIFYQQSAVVDKRLPIKAIQKEKHDTAVGTVLTQAIMMVYIITFAATLHHAGSHQPLNRLMDLPRILVLLILKTYLVQVSLMEQWWQR